MAFCPKCGNQLSPDALTCPSCGADIDQAAAATAAPPPPPDTAPPAAETPLPEATTTPPPMPPGAGFAPPSPPPPSAPVPPAGAPVFAPPPAGPAFAPPPPGGPMPPGPAWPSPVAGKKTSGLAVASLILAITGFICLPILGPILGIIFGLMAKSQIKKESGRLEGGGLATAGIVLSVIAIVLFLAIVVPASIWFINTVKGPMDTTNNFIEYVKEGNVSDAYDLLAPGTATRNEMEEFVDDHKGTPKEYFAFSTSINDNRAEVTVRFTDSSGDDYEDTFELRKVDGEWLITYVPNW